MPTLQRDKTPSWHGIIFPQILADSDKGDFRVLIQRYPGARYVTLAGIPILSNIRKTSRDETKYISVSYHPITTSNLEVGNRLCIRLLIFVARKNWMPIFYEFNIT